MLAVQAQNDIMILYLPLFIALPADNNAVNGYKKQDVSTVFSRFFIQ